MQLDIQGIGMTSQRTRDRLISRLREAGITNEYVLMVLRDTPRHVFMDEAMASRAYEDTALPIGYGQTISQPYIVARMTEAILRNGIPKRVLEIGTGSGYQTAVLARLAEQVFSVERIGALQAQARKRLSALNLHNIQYRLGDGYAGWSKHAPYDAILVTAAPSSIPDTLRTQLADGGKLVIPVGESMQQRLMLITHTGSEYKEEILDLVSFVPMVKDD